MLLHKDKNLFEQTIFQVAQRSGIESGIIEKDYYVSLLLKELSQTLPSMIFKGGTSLSKCHKVIKRFSEDIDITLDENHLSQGNRKSVKTAIVNACEKLGFSISNLDDIKSGMDFNHYKIEYSGLFMIDGLKPDIEIDTIFSIRSFPYEQKMATSIIYDYLHEMGLDEFIDTYELLPYPVNTQSIDRTFIDKVFALCDYYLEGKTKERSRHLYDIYKLYPLLSDDDMIRVLAKETRDVRSNSPFCESANSTKDINVLLQEIIDKEYYRIDYKENTTILLYDDISYEEAITVLAKVISKKLF